MTGIGDSGGVFGGMFSGLSDAAGGGGNSGSSSSGGDTVAWDSGQYDNYSKNYTPDKYDYSKMDYNF